MNDIATNEELRGIARSIKTRGLAKALRALEETQRRNRATANGGKRTRCAMCEGYETKSCDDVCPVGFDIDDDSDDVDKSICGRVIGNKLPAYAKADVCRDLARYVRAEIKRRAKK